MSLIKKQGINVNILKNRVNNQNKVDNNQNLDNEKIKNIVSSFKFVIINQKFNQSKFKT